MGHVRRPKAAPYNLNTSPDRLLRLQNPDVALPNAWRKLPCEKRERNVRLDRPMACLAPGRPETLAPHAGPEDGNVIVTERHAADGCLTGPSLMPKGATGVRYKPEHNRHRPVSGLDPVRDSLLAAPRGPFPPSIRDPSVVFAGAVPPNDLS
jgi:hypothetical protein